MTWYPYVGYGTFWVALVVAIILYAIKRKWYPILYLVSVSLYIFTISFVIDVFELSRNWILLLLAFSSAVMVAIGMYLSKRFRKK